MKRFQSITHKLQSVYIVALLLVLWLIVSEGGIVPRFLLPSPLDVMRALVGSFPELMGHTAISLAEAFAGLFIGIGAAFLLAVLMDRFGFVYRSLYPLLVITQTIPTVAIAPLLVLWMGYDLTPKITLVTLVCFFPVTVALLDGFRTADPDAVNLLRTMGASRGQIFRHIRLPSALPGFVSGLRVSVSYAIVGAVIAEWLGGLGGLGVYMIRVKKSYSYDKMFAVIFLIVAISLVLMQGVKLLERRLMPWRRFEAER